MRSLLLAAVLAVPPLCAQHDPVLVGVPANATNVLVVRDLLPHVDALLQSKWLAGITKATADLQVDRFGASYDPEQLARLLEPMRHFVPRDIVVAMPPSSMRSLAHLHAAMLFAQSKYLQREEDERLRAVVELAQAQLAEVRLPSIHARVRARSEETARSWFEAAADFLYATERTGHRAVVKRSRIEVTFVLGEVLEGGVGKQLRAFGLDSSRIDALRGGFSIVHDGDSLVLRTNDLGVDVETTGQLADAHLGPLWSLDGSQLAFVAFDLAEATAVLAACCDAADRLLDSQPPESEGNPLAEAVLDLADHFDTLASLAPRIAQVLEVDGGLAWIREHDYPPDRMQLEPLPAELLRCTTLANDVVLLFENPLDEVLHDSVAVALDELREHRRDRQARTLHDAITGVGGSALEFLGGEESVVFDDGCAVVVRESEILDVRWRGQGLGQLPYPAIALVARARDEASGAAFCDTLAEAIGSGFGVDAFGWEAKDLGLAVPTRTLAWQRFLPADSGVGSGLELHAAQKGRWLVLSTDVRLSQDVLKCLATKDLPDSVEPGLRSSIRFSGEQLAVALGMVDRWSGKIDELEGSLRFLVDPRLLRLLRRVSRRFASCEDQGVMRERILRFESRLRFLEERQNGSTGR